MYLERLNKDVISIFVSFFILFCPQHSHIELEEVAEEVYVSAYTLGTFSEIKKTWAKTKLSKIRIKLWNIYSVPRRCKGKSLIFTHVDYLAMIGALFFKKLYSLLTPEAFSSRMILSY